MDRFSFMILATAVSISPVLAEEAHRELGPHVHGHGTLNIAVEAKRVSMELEVPGMDIVGFEHEAKGKEQTATVDGAKALLAEPLKIFKIPAAAGCKVAETKIAIEAEHHHDDEDEKAEAGHANGDHDEDEHAGHTEFHVTYALDCADPAKLASIEFDYFQSFAGAHDLTVNVVTASGQNSFEVNRDKPVLDLGGMM